MVELITLSFSLSFEFTHFTDIEYLKLLRMFRGYIHGSALLEAVVPNQSTPWSDRHKSITYGELTTLSFSRSS